MEIDRGDEPEWRCVILQMMKDEGLAAFPHAAEILDDRVRKN